MMPVSARGADIGLPPTRISPSLGPSSPATIMSRVLLPQPDGPSRETNSPDSILNEVGATASTCPRLPALKTLRTLSTAT